jgi:hypothetical protein
MPAPTASTPPPARPEPEVPAKPQAPAEPVHAAHEPPPWAPAPLPKPQTQADVDWPAPVDVPAWAPRIHIGPARSEAPLEPEPPTPKPAPVAAAPEPAPAPKPTPTPPATPSVSKPPPPPSGTQAGAAKDSKSSWEVVKQKEVPDPLQFVPTAEDRSYAEWFAWAKRGGAPASACHAAAQGAFQALASGKDIAVAVQWATAAMSRPPIPVSAGRQTYCAWFSLANIDLNIDQHRAHLFAAGAMHALDMGADAGTAHAAGLAAAGFR